MPQISSKLMMMKNKFHFLKQKKTTLSGLFFILKVLRRNYTDTFNALPANPDGG